EFPESWGAHGWAEVYFPGYGWMPFDVTYGEYGFIDPTHVKLKESLDPNEPSTKYKWFGYNTDIKTSQLTINTELKRYSGSFPDEISIQAKPFVKEVAFGSYNIIEATVKNLNDYYVATDLRIIKPEEVTADESLPVMLRPGEEKIVFFVVQLTGRFDPDYIYFFPVKIVSSTNISASSEFNASSHGTYLTLEEVNAVVKQKTTETKEFRTSLVLVCTPEKKEFYQYEEAYANCNIRNNGNVLLKALKICLETDCRNIELGISETKQVRFALPKTKLGQQIASITAENQDISNAAYLEYSVLDEPDIEITDITYPGSVSYDDTYQISYTINKISSSIPEDVSVKLDYGFVKEWVISELNVNKKFDLTMSAEELSVGANRFFIIVSYEDKNGKAFQKQQEFEITLNKPTFTQRIRIFFNDIGKFIIGIFT
ncbi:MAG: transglutaminase-like domain-containing protein, partial [Nanoarchaeota archaeon]|nr:transglutaminase-like domain-containing protein [Nanoarchaeota archaeon]